MVNRAGDAGEAGEEELILISSLKSV